MEVALIPMTGKPSLYPGLFLFTTPCRLVRPVQNLELGKEELIGTMEQVHRALCWCLNMFVWYTTFGDLITAVFLKILSLFNKDRAF